MISWLYGKITDFRNQLYEKDVLKSFSLGAKTVSVGNLTVGGTGKTPLVAFIAEILAESGEKVCILTRGYGRENPGKRVLVSDGEKVSADVKRAGDEPFELAGKLSGKAIVVADANRVSAARWAREKFGVTVFILDDAFQHRRAKRDLDIVCIDATAPFGNFKILPAGILRESLKNLKRADLIVVSRANLIEDSEDLKMKIREYNSVCPIFVSENRISNLIDIREFNAKAQRRRGAEKETELQTNADEKEFLFDKENLGLGTWDLGLRKALAFCGLGNPNNFYEQLRREQFNLIAAETFPDHHFYRQSDIEKLDIKTKETGAEILLTTAKDAVKLKDLQFNTPCYVVETELRFEDEKSFRETIESVARRN
jgi:tetraacyldisaccharide 4'-kinase